MKRTEFQRFLFEKPTTAKKRNHIYYLRCDAHSHFVLTVMSNSLLAIRAASESNTAEQKRASERKRNVLILINQHLIENGYIESAERLQHESGGVLNKFVGADNVDLPLILSEYESYYEMRFDKKPKLVRKLNDGEEGPAALRNMKLSSNTSNSKKGGIATKDKKSNNDSELVKLPSVNGATSTPDSGPDLGFGVAGTSIAAQDKKNKGAADDNPHDKLEERYVGASQSSVLRLTVLPDYCVRHRSLAETRSSSSWPT